MLSFPTADGWKVILLLFPSVSFVLLSFLLSLVLPKEISSIILSESVSEKGLSAARPSGNLETV